MRAVLMELGLRPLGGNYRTVRRRIVALGLPTTHWLGQGWLRGTKNTFNPPRSLDDVLRPGTRYPSAKLKTRLLSVGFLDPVCSRCLNSLWLDAPIPLELDHIDGDSDNNALSNLRLLCPNCHALTPTYRARNARYSHIPPLADIQRGIAEAGSIANYAAQRGATSGQVRGWLRSERLRRMSKVSENVALYRVFACPSGGIGRHRGLKQLSAARETARM